MQASTPVPATPQIVQSASNPPPKAGVTSPDAESEFLDVLDPNATPPSGTGRAPGDPTDMSAGALGAFGDVPAARLITSAPGGDTGNRSKRTLTLDSPEPGRPTDGSSSGQSRGIADAAGDGAARIIRADVPGTVDGARDTPDAARPQIAQTTALGTAKSTAAVARELPKSALPQDLQPSARSYGREQASIPIAGQNQLSSASIDQAPGVGSAKNLQTPPPPTPAPTQELDVASTAPKPEVSAKETPGVARLTEATIPISAKKGQQPAPGVVRTSPDAATTPTRPLTSNSAQAVPPATAAKAADLGTAAPVTPPINANGPAPLAGEVSARFASPSAGTKDQDQSVFKASQAFADGTRASEENPFWRSRYDTSGSAQARIEKTAFGPANASGPKVEQISQAKTLLAFKPQSPTNLPSNGTNLDRLGAQPGVEDVFGIGQAGLVSTTALPGPPHLTGAPLAGHIANQISAAMPRQDGLIVTPTTTEIALDPPELGKLRIVVSDGANGINISITAERGETADLMRRHIDLLRQEFARDGVAGGSIEFTQGDPSQRGEQNAQDRPEERPGSAPDGADAPSLITATGQPQTGRTSSGGLDLRL